MYSTDLNIGNYILNDFYTTADNNECNVLINNVLRDMQKFLNSRQLSELNKLLNKVIKNYSISSEVIVDIDYKEMNKTLLEQFNKSKRLIGLAESTLTVYNDVIGYLLRFHDKGLAEMTSDDIRECSDTSALAPRSNNMNGSSHSFARGNFSQHASG